MCGFSYRSWVAYDGENFSGNQYVLEEGHYPCLSSMGCLPGTTVKSLRFIDVVSMSVTVALQRCTVHTPDGQSKKPANRPTRD